MTPEERNLVTDLFDRLGRLEASPRDREAERLIQDGLRQAPNATYALVQTALIQAEAQPMAQAPMMAQPSPGGSFLGTAAATAAGVIGGSLMMDSIRSMMGHHGGTAHAAYEPA